MTTHPLGGVAVTNAELDERARNAVKAFRKLQPTLTAYARVLTRDSRVTVEMTSNENAATSGRKIFIRPPLALGDPTEHNRSLCDRRDENKQQRCEACRTREHVLVLVYHEIAHIAYGSFEKPRDADIAQAVETAIKRSSSLKARSLEVEVNRAVSEGRLSYMHLANFISEFLPLVHNALEDARINAAQFKARKGTKAMFDADVWRVFTEGVEQTDPLTGKTIVKSWREYSQNMQVIVGLMCKVSGYDYTDWFIPPVIEALEDKELNDLVIQFDTVRTAAQVYEIAVPVLLRLKELGFCLKDSDKLPEEDPESGSSDDADDTDDGEEKEAVDEGTGSSGSDSKESESDANGDASGGEESDGSSGVQSDSDDTDAGTETDEDESPADGSDESSTDEPDTQGASEPEQFDESSDDETDGEVDEDSGDDDSGVPDESSSGSPDSSSSGSPGAGSEVQPVDRDSTLPEEEQEGGRDSDSDSTTEEESDDDLVDTGADEGKGGSRVVEHESWDDVPMGGIEEIKKGLKEWTLHGDPPPEVYEQERRAAQAIERAIIQGLYFETPSRFIAGVREHRYDAHVYQDGYDTSEAWDGRGDSVRREDIETPEAMLGRTLLKMRVAFSDNQRAAKQHHLKSGRINMRTLAKRAPFNDERLFSRKIIPGKRDYFVLVGLDISGSTAGVNLRLIKKAAFAQAALLNRLGVTFAIYAHTGNYHSFAGGRTQGLDLDIYIVKEANEPWSTEVKNRLIALRESAANLDGHTLEYYRKVCDRRPETDKVILYFSDGKMPAENYDEELEILQREIKICRAKKYTLLGVGIRTDSPARHGLDTVEINSVGDLHLVVDQLGKHLAKLQVQ